MLLVHEGAPGTDCAPMDDDPTSDFGSIITGVNDKVDAIVSGHTHLAYNCSFPVAGWAGRPVTERPVVSAGQYGMALNKLTFEYNKVTDQVGQRREPSVLLPLKAGQPAWTNNYPSDPNTAAIVAALWRTLRSAGCAAAGRDRWSVLPRQAGGRLDREPWRRVDPGQPGRRGAAVEHP